MLKVSDIARLALAKFMYRYHKFKVPNFIITENYFTPINEIHSYNTQSSSSKRYFLPSVNTTAGRRSLLFRGTKLWNAIAVDIKQYPYHKFVKYYKIYLIHKYPDPAPRGAFRGRAPPTDCLCPPNENCAPPSEDCAPKKLIGSGLLERKSRPKMVFFMDLHRFL